MHVEVSRTGFARTFHQARRPQRSVVVRPEYALRGLSVHPLLSALNRYQEVFLQRAGRSPPPLPLSCS